MNNDSSPDEDTSDIAPPPPPQTSSSSSAPLLTPPSTPPLTDGTGRLGPMSDFQFYRCFTEGSEEQRRRMLACRECMALSTQVFERRDEPDRVAALVALEAHQTQRSPECFSHKMQCYYCLNTNHNWSCDCTYEQMYGPQRPWVQPYPPPSYWPGENSRNEAYSSEDEPGSSENDNTNSAIPIGDFRFPELVRRAKNGNTFMCPKCAELVIDVWEHRDSPDRLRFLVAFDAHKRHIQERTRRCFLDNILCLYCLSQNWSCTCTDIQQFGPPKPWTLPAPPLPQTSSSSSAPLLTPP